MNCVYVVEEGEYSSYHVVAIFSEKDAAETFSKHRPGSNVVSWELDTWNQEQAEYGFVFGLDGEVVSSRETAYTGKHQYDGQIFSQAMDDGIVVRVHRGPREVALKIASERYTRIRAFYDQAETMCAKQLPNLEKLLRVTVVGMVAEVLAGIRDLPEGEGSGFEEYAKIALGRKATK